MRGIEMHGCCRSAVAPLNLYSWCPWHRRHHSPADTSTVHPHHVVHSLTARARTHAHAHTHAHTHAQDEHTHTPHALPLCRWHCCHHPQIYLHPHRHRTRTHAHGTRTHTRCHSASLPLHLYYLRCWHRRCHPPPRYLSAPTPSHAHAHSHRTHTRTRTRTLTRTQMSTLTPRTHCCSAVGTVATTPRYLHPHRHRTRTHAHGTRTHTRCHSASLPLHLYLRRWHRCRHPQIAALEDDSPHVPKAVYSPEVPVAAYT